MLEGYQSQLLNSLLQSFSEVGEFREIDLLHPELRFGLPPNVED
jgi:hypothetical protein